VISNFLNKTPVVKITEKSLRGYGSEDHRLEGKGQYFFSSFNP
jgi:hypothetical protein